MRVVIIGAGAVGSQVGSQLLALPDLEDLGVVDSDQARARALAASLGQPARAERWAPVILEGASVVVLTHGGEHWQVADAALGLDAGPHVVSTAAATADVRRLLDLDAEATRQGRHVVVGAGFSPGLTCILSRHAASSFDTVEEVHVAKVGTAGPACARQHHQALRNKAVDWRDDTWTEHRSGSGRELCWFPDPIGAVDCYRASLPDPLLMVAAFPEARRVTARMGAGLRDRLTTRVPMLWRPPPEGATGAIRVEVRGRRGVARDVMVLGAIDRPAVAAGTVAAVAAAWAVSGSLARAGAGGLAELADPVPFLAELARRGVKAAIFEGASVGSLPSRSPT